MRSGHFLSKTKTVSRVSKVYPLLFPSKSSMVGQLGDIQELNIYPTSILVTFSKISGRPKDM